MNSIAIRSLGATSRWRTHGVAMITLALAGGAVLGACGAVLGQEQPARRYLIVHADDAGMSHSANVGTIEGMEKGIVTSASIMVPCPWFKEFAQYAKANPHRDFGIHLTLTCEWDLYRWGPVASRDQVPSLVDEEGYLWDNSRLVAENVKAEEVRIELKAQIDRAMQFGVPLTHLDTHMGSLFSRPDLVEVYVDLGVEYQLPVLMLRTLDDAIRQGYPALAAKHAPALARLDEHQLPVLDNIVQIYGGELPERERNYFDALPKLPAGVSEMIIHCGFDNEELRAITNSSARRDQDRRLFTSEEMKRAIEEQGIELLSWKQFHQMAKENAAR